MDLKVRACHSQNAQISSDEPFLVYTIPKGVKIPDTLQGWAGPNILRGIQVVEPKQHPDEDIQVELRCEHYQKIPQGYAGS